MEMSVNDVAHLFNVSADTVYRWIHESGMPAAKFSDRYHFNRVRLVEWAHENRIPLRIDSESGVPSLEEALCRGGVHHDLDGGVKREVLASVVERMPLPDGVDRGFLLEMLLAREKQGSTGFGEGVAIPHARNPILLRVDEPLVMLCYLKQPVDFESLDGKPVTTLFSMIVPAAPVHLGLLAQLGGVLRDDAFKALLKRKAGLEEIIERVRSIQAANVLGEFRVERPA
ncbi:MAG: PTS sugar transporter subunit IIA [Candidatus Hydrogenedentes bacterium]|nr:PTS sugar transporter subunit IIA [Candidatus Hydrogenedentota bacterium]